MRVEHCPACGTTWPAPLPAEDTWACETCGKRTLIVELTDPPADFDLRNMQLFHIPTDEECAQWIKEASHAN